MASAKLVIFEISNKISLWMTIPKCLYSLHEVSPLLVCPIIAKLYGHRGTLMMLMVVCSVVYV